MASGTRRALTPASWETVVIHTIDFSTIDLFGRVAALGNHYQKHVSNIEKNFDALVSLIDAQHLFDQFQLLRFSSQPAREMKLIAAFLEDRETLLEMLGCYYAIQILLMNIKALDVLQLNLSLSADRFRNYHNFLFQTGLDFRLLSGAYMSVLLDIFLPKAHRPDFVACGVGTRVDQDDIDLGVIDRGEEERPIITKAFDALNREMLKNASALHFHLSEHVGKQGYSASIQEYHELLDPEIQDFVILSEMLNAVPILGRLQLFREFKREILDRYYYHRDRDNKYHEGCLRGLLGEIRDLMLKEVPDHVLNPKRDALRMLKAVIFAMKTYRGIHRNTTLEVLDVLIKTDRANREDYLKIHQAHTFFETFRFLYQLLVVQDEDIYLEEDFIPHNLQGVAKAMGYEDKSCAPAYTQLLIHYQDYLKIARQGTKNLLAQLTRHLNRTTIFTPVIGRQSREQPGVTDNLAVEFMRTSAFFQGARFWDDLLNILDSNKKILDRFLDGFMTLDEGRRESLIKTYIRWGNLSPIALISLITIVIRHYPNLVGSDFINEFLKGFIQQQETTQDTTSRLCYALNFDPQTMNIFLGLLDDKYLNRLVEILEQPVWKPEIQNAQRNLIILCKLYRNSSYYFRRFIQRIFNSYAPYILSLNDPAKFAQLADGLLRNLDNFSTLPQKVDKLGDYYDFEFLRLGIQLLNGGNFEDINKQFTIFSDNYIRILYELCRSEVIQEMDFHFPGTRDLLAIFVAGGHARSQSFDDDYDLIILLNSTDKEILKFANRIILKMNKRIIKRSIMTHYRFADRFKNYVTTFSNLTGFFKEPDQYAFIDISQLLGARMIVGSAHFQEAFEREIITPFVFDNKRSFITALRKEIISHHGYHTVRGTINIKESPGGLRDIENFLFILKCYYVIKVPISPKLFTRLADYLNKRKSILEELQESYYFLKQVRDLFRLIVADSDVLVDKYLAKIIDPLNISRQTSLSRGLELQHAIRHAMQQNVKHIYQILRQDIKV
jgi:hypothetical protein